MEGKTTEIEQIENKIMNPSAKSYKKKKLSERLSGGRKGSRGMKQIGGGNWTDKGIGGIRTLYALYPIMKKW